MTLKSKFRNVELCFNDLHHQRLVKQGPRSSIDFFHNTLICFFSHRICNISTLAQQRQPFHTETHVRDESHDFHSKNTNSYITPGCNLELIALNDSSWPQQHRNAVPTKIYFLVKSTSKHDVQLFSTRLNRRYIINF